MCVGVVVMVGVGPNVQKMIDFSSGISQLHATAWWVAGGSVT